MPHAGPFDEELGSAAGLPDIGGYITASPPGNVIGFFDKVVSMSLGPPGILATALLLSFLAHFLRQLLGLS